MKNIKLDNYLLHLHEQAVELYESIAKNDKTSIKKIIDKEILGKV